MGTSIFEFKTYREYLTAVFANAKERDKKFSLSYFSRKIEMSETYLKQVLAGRRRLSVENAKSLADVLNLNSSEHPFLLTMVMKESAKSKVLATYFDSVLLGLKERAQLDYSRDELLMCIFHNAITWEIYTLVALPEFQNDATWIARKLGYRNVAQVSEALHFLFDRKALTKDDEGRVWAKNAIFNDSLSQKTASFGTMPLYLNPLQFEDVPWTALVGLTREM